MKQSVKYLRNKEWSMGCGGSQNRGQCPDCCGKSLMWIEDFGGWGTYFGHEPGCPLASALESEGETVVWLQEYKGDKSSSLFRTKEEANSSWLSDNEIFKLLIGDT